MNRLTAFARRLLPLLTLIPACAMAAPITVRDDNGSTLTLKTPAQRVIALAPSLAELVFEVGGGERLIGAVEYSDYPPQASKLPRIGSNQKLDLERVVKLKPDLILVWYHGNAHREIERLAALKIPMFHLEPKNISDIPGAMERIGRLLDTRTIADAAILRFRDQHARLLREYGGRAPVRTFYQVYERPLLTINNHQLISDVIRLCGGVNVFGKEPMLVPQLSTESVVAANPEVILTANMGGGGGTAQRAMDEPRLAEWLKFGNMAAVKSQQLWLIPGDLISRHGPRILDGAEAVCTALDDARKRR